MKKSKQPLTIYEKENIDSVFSNQQLLVLLQKTPNRYIRTRPAKGGGTWDYVSGAYVKKTLNYAFGFLWSSEVKDIEEKHGQISATVRVTIHKPDGTPLIWKEDIGKKDIVMKKGTTIPLDYGNDKKSAITDGIKRCAAQFGIASDIYGKEEFREVEIEDVQEVQEDKHRKRLVDHIKNSKTVEELRECFEAVFNSEDDVLIEFYDVRKMELEKKGIDNTV